jgi:hypothetical protein
MTQAQDQMLVESLMQGATQEQAAQAAGYHVNTVTRRMRSDAFRRQLVEAQLATRDRVVRALVSSSQHAIRCLLEAVSSPAVPWPVRVRAASALLDHSVGRSVAVTVTGQVDVEVASPRDELLARLDRLQARAITTTAEEIPGSSPPD